jgi:hypothetical protein
MKSWLTFAPWWVLSLILIVLFSIIRVLASVLLHVLDLSPYDFSADVGGDLFSAVFLGLVLGPFFAYSNRRAEAAAGLENREEFLAASRSVVRGPAPTDPRLRSAAFRMAAQQHEVTQRAFRFTLPVLGLAAAALIVLAFFSSFWLLLVGAMLGLVLVLNAFAVRRLERRMLVLFDRQAYEDDLESGHY